MSDDPLPAFGRQFRAFFDAMVAAGIAYIEQTRPVFEALAKVDLRIDDQPGSEPDTKKH